MTRQKPNKTINSSYLVTDSDIGYTLRCESLTDIEITLPSPTGRLNFDLLIINMEVGEVTCLGKIITKDSHAHVIGDGTEWTIATGGGSGSEVEIDPVFMASPAGSITETNKTNWNAAYSKSLRFFEPLVNGDIENPEIMFDITGEIIMVEV